MKSLCRTRIRVENLLHNLEILRSSGKNIMPVVKADAYGHGLLTAAEALASRGVDHFAVGATAEGLELRQAGISGTIVTLLGLSPLDESTRYFGSQPVFEEDALASRTYNITPLIHDTASLIRFGELTKGSPAGSIAVAIKCDTGMARIGFLPKDMGHVCELLARAPQLRPDLLISHLAVADEVEQDEFTRTQASRFMAAATVLRAHFPDIKLSLGNSACLMACPELAGDLARPGYSLYGGNPFYGTSREHLGKGLLPVMESMAPILEVHPLRAGQSLGYGRSFVADHDMTVAVVGIGYADGYRRVPGQQMSVNGMRAPVLGRVTMQMTCIDVSAIPDVKPGSSAYVLGGESNPVRAEELAAWWNTIPYEVTCLLGNLER